MSILDILAKQGIIETKDLASIQEKSESTGKSLEEILISMGVSEEDILKAKAEYHTVPTKKVNVSSVTSQVLEYISEEAAVYYHFVPIGLNNGILEVGMIDPDNISAKDALNFISSKIGLPFKIFLISEVDFDKVIALYKGLSSEVTKALTELETEFVTQPGEREDSEEKNEKDKKLEEAAEEENNLSSSENEGKDAKIIQNAPVTKIVATMLRYAIDGRASDIHIEPGASNVRIRFRVDGVMNTSLVLPM
jgi:type IV pilus assembly protein PilB